MAGGATFSPQLLIDGKRPLDKYPPARDVLLETARGYLVKPLFPTACAVLFWPLYRALLRRCRKLSEAGCFTLALSLCINCSYSIWHLFYAVIERYQLLDEHKLDRQAHQLGTRKLVLATLKDGLLGKFVLGPAMIYTVLFPIMKSRGMPAMTAARPSAFRIYAEFSFAHLVNEFFFYWAHRTFHSSQLYARVHKQHHEWKGTVSMAAEYAGPVEQLFANYIPTLGGCFLLASHPWTLAIWLAERLRNTYEGHSGYAFRHPLLNALGVVDWKGAADHDFHHTGNCGNFSPAWCDWLFGTMDAYVAQGGAEGYVRSKIGEKLSYMRAK